MINKDLFMRYNLIFYLVILTFSCFSCVEDSHESKFLIDLSGRWQFDIDSADSGIEQQWFKKELSDSVVLPGTMDLNHKGYENNATTTKHLNRLFLYTGPAWYKKAVFIPSDWQDLHIQLLLERTKSSKIWIDGKYVGESRLLESPQKYDVSRFLSPGEHTIAVRIDNSSRLTPYGYTHLNSDHTQTNWNGIIGKLLLEASSKTYISGLQVFPDIEAKKVRAKLSVDNQLNIDDVDIELQVFREVGEKRTRLKSKKYRVACDSIIELEYDLGEKAELWDEFSQPIYKLNAIIRSNKQILDSQEVPFGMRKFATKGTSFTINNRATFLRGKHDACVFPLTGCPPMDTEGWLRVFRIAKSYGINHYRFHTWCPPEAAFEAADKVGIYLQPELPFWNIKSDTLMNMFLKEGTALLNSYANHPSFVMFSVGNEISGNQKKIEALIARLKQVDSRPLYTQGSNNNIGYSFPIASADFHVTARMPYIYDTLLMESNVENPAIGVANPYDTILTHVRLSHAFLDSKDGGIINGCPPSTNFNYDFAVSQTNVPIVGHEVGQYQIYPDYNEIAKYTGILKPRNLEFFRDQLEKAGMLDQNEAFTKASGALAAMCYRAEIEAAIRTKGFGGFQLLDLQDFPGQGTALVGILDAFMESKNVISREEWVQFCNAVVPLLSFEKYCWTNNEIFSATVQVANYSDKDISQNLNWKVLSSNGDVINKGVFANNPISTGGLQSIGHIEIPLNSVKVPDKLNIVLFLDQTSYKNSYPIWVYPEPQDLEKDSDILITAGLSKSLFSRLKQGKKVLCFPNATSVSNNSVGGLFINDFWNYNMFKGLSERFNRVVSPGTLGILTNPDHPIFNDFPTDFYTNWQWWSILKNSNPVILNITKSDFRPIVQVIDNLERNNKLGLIFEFKVGEGRLLICMSDLNKQLDKPEGLQLYQSILKYMKSDRFNPEYSVDENSIREIIQ